MKPYLVAITALLALSACSTWMPAQHSAPAMKQAALAVVPNSEQLPGAWPMTEWWRRYNDATLNELVARALRGAPSLAQAEARFNNARESARITAAASGLQVAAQASVARIRLSDNGLFPTSFLGFNWYNQSDLGIAATYHFDWWHKQRQVTQAAVYQARAAQAEQLAASVTLSGAVVESYLGWQADQAQLAIIDQQLQLLDRQQGINNARIQASLDNADGAYQLQVQRAILNQQRTQWQFSAQLQRVVIASLLGDSETNLPAFEAKLIDIDDAGLPEQLTVDLLAHRADIASAYWRVKASEQQLGAARAEFMPDVSLNVLAALSSIDLGKLLEKGSAAPSVGLAVHLPLFDSGLLTAQYGARAAEVDAAVASYNQTVVTASRDVASAVLQMQRTRAEQHQLQQQEHALTQLLNMASQRHQQGLTDLRPVLAAQQTLLQQQAQDAALQAAHNAADLQLQLALGGGYADNIAASNNESSASVLQ